MINSQIHKDSFSQVSFRRHLRSRTFGTHITYSEHVDSTNTVAKQYVEDQSNHGMLILTDDQTQGRGRSSKSWFSTERKGLTFSLIVHPKIEATKTGLFALLAGVALCDAMESIDLAPQLKWPNDVMVNGKKIAGILCESKLHGSTIKSVIIGIGLNVNETENDFPFELRKLATSIGLLTGQFCSREKFLGTILLHLENNYEHLIKGEEGGLMRRWLNYSFQIGQPISFHKGNQLVSGIFVGLSPVGEAILDINGEKQIISSGQIID